jgi:hypothetical protein
MFFNDYIIPFVDEFDSSAQKNETIPILKKVLDLLIRN